MIGSNAVSDKELLKNVNRKLDRAGGGSRSQLKATVQRGTVTLSGQLKYDNQRMPLMKAASSVPGVRHVVDQLQAPPKVKPPHRA
jgi:osmotically-inducible protein OsmY